MTNKSGIFLMLIALGLLIPGVTKPILILAGTVDKAEMIELGMQALADSPDVPAFMLSITEQLVTQLDIKGDLPAYNKTRSIVGTVEELYDARQYLVAFLIALFSIVIPVTKSLLMVISALFKNRLGQISKSITALISKWSMADVFVVAIIVAFLAANATQQTEELFSLTAKFGEGFYYFLGYCLLSILSMQVMAWRGGAQAGSATGQTG
ncbi:MAG: paraquat-inducible protein A [Gammaproteobacteria bacterium]|nr:paraquat-inducible protein A [Gammaproteobacteria bacterium]